MNIDTLVRALEDTLATAETPVKVVFQDKVLEIIGVTYEDDEVSIICQYKNFHDLTGKEMEKVFANIKNR